MGKNIIDQKELENHVIQRYRFRVLGSAATVVEENAERTESDGDEQNIAEEVLESIAPQEESSTDNIPDSSFVEELLKKSDELSSNIIKLQMQIEKQEIEFQKRLEEEIKRAKEDGFNEGYEKAKLELSEEIDNAIQIYKNSAKKLDETTKKIDDFLLSLRDEIASTSVEIAKEVIQKEVSQNSIEIAKALSKELIEELKDAIKIVLKVNPEDFEALSEIYKDNKRVEVEADSAVSKGGVVLLSDSGNLDGNLSLRLEKVKYLLQDK